MVAPETSLSSPRAPLSYKKGFHQAASDEGETRGIWDILIEVLGLGCLVSQ